MLGLVLGTTTLRVVLCMGATTLRVVFVGRRYAERGGTRGTGTDGLQRHLAQIHARARLRPAIGRVVRTLDTHKPLLRTPEDDGRFGSPVVRIRVREGVIEEEVAGVAQPLGHFPVRVKDRNAPEPLGHGVVVGAVALHGAVDRQALAQAGGVVVLTVAGGGMHEPRAVLGRDIFRCDDGPQLGRVALAAEAAGGRICDKRMLVAQADELVAGGGGEHDDALGLGHLGDLVHERRGHHRGVAVDPREGVFRARMHGHADIRGERPGRGRPDHETRTGVGTLARVDGRAALLGALGVLLVLVDVVGRMFREPERAVDGVRALGLEIDVDREVFAILVFQFRLGERRFVGDGPMHRLERAIHQALLDEVREHFQRRALECRRHRHVRVRIVCERQQPFHLPGLQFDISLGGLLAFPAHGHLALVVGKPGHLGQLAGFKKFLHHFVLDGEAVTVPAGDIRAVQAVGGAHGLGAHHQVLERLVHQVAHVDVAVGVWRAIVEGELGLAGPLGADGFVQSLAGADRAPAFDAGGLVLHQIRLHGETGLGEVECVLV